jgi:hypothetical protein
MWPGTRSERAKLAAIHRGHKPLQKCCCTRRHIRLQPRLDRQARLDRQERTPLDRPPSKQSGSLWRLLIVLSARVNIGAVNIVPLLCSDPSCPPVLMGFTPELHTQRPRLRGSFSSNHFSAASLVAKTLMWSAASLRTTSVRDRVPQKIRSDTLKSEYEVICHLLSRDVPESVLFSAQETHLT